MRINGHIKSLSKTKGGIRLEFLSRGKPYLFDLATDSTLGAISIGSFLELEVANGKVLNFNVLSKSKRNVSFDLKTANRNQKMKYPWLKMRNLESRDTYRLRMFLINTFRDYFIRNGYIELVSPKIVSVSLESNADAFEFEFYGERACLAKGPQLYKTIAISGGLDKIFEISPVFRKETNYASNYVSEFTAIDLDIAYVDSVNEVMDEFENLFRHVFGKLNASNKMFENLDIRTIYYDKMPRINMKEARNILESYGKILKDGDPLDKEAEEILGRWGDKNKTDLIMVYDFPWSDRFFYHRKGKDGIGSESFDILFKGVEIATCGIKENRKEVITQQAKDKKMNMNKLSKYFELFDYGLPPYGGGGIGLDRLLKKILQKEDVRDVIMFPRYPPYLTP